MRRARILGVLAGVLASLVLTMPVLAHGDHDARPIARNVRAGGYSVSVWQVYPDAGASMTPHLIVMFDGAMPEGVGVEVNRQPVGVVRSVTTRNGWETTVAVKDFDVVSITVTDGSRSWRLGAIVVPPPPTSMFPMRELLYGAIGLTATAALWLAARTRRAWQRPSMRPA